jgi:hypothetical protein
MWIASIILVGPYGLLWTYCSRPYAAYVICAILWTLVLTPKVIMYIVGVTGLGAASRAGVHVSCATGQESVILSE